MSIHYLFVLQIQINWESHEILVRNLDEFILLVRSTRLELEFIDAVFEMENAFYDAWNSINGLE